MAKAKRLPSGSYRVLLYIGTDPTGKRQYKSFTAETAKEAERQAALYEIGHDGTASYHMTLNEACLEYVNNRVNVLSPWTISTYTKYIERDIKPISGTRIDRITVAICQQFVSMFASTHAPKTTQNVFGFMRSVIRLYNKTLSIDDVRLPQKQKAEITIPTDEQIQCANLTATDHYTKAAIALCAGLGMRRGEIAALHREDVTDTTIHVRRALAKQKDGKKSKWVEKPPKTLAGDRVLTLPPSISALLKSLPVSDTSPYLIPLTPDAITRRWERICKKADIHCRFYDLRHYYASTMLALGIPDLYAMERMGHATPNMLKTVYQHIQDQKRKEVGNLIDGKVNDLFK